MVFWGVKHGKQVWDTEEGVCSRREECRRRDAARDLKDRPRRNARTRELRRQRPDVYRAIHARFRAKRESAFQEFKRSTKYRRGHPHPHDNLVFWCYSVSTLGFCKWVSPSKAVELNADSRSRVKALLSASPQFSVATKIRSRLTVALKKARVGKRNSRGADAGTVRWLLWLANRLGIDPRDGRKNHIEHLRSTRCFDLSTKEGQIAFNAPENTWWLPAQDNLSKNDRDPTPDEIELHGLYLAEYRQTLK